MAGIESRLDRVDGIESLGDLLRALYRSVASEIDDVLDDIFESSVSNDGLWPVPPESVQKSDELRWPEMETRPEEPESPEFTGHRFDLGEK